METASPLRENFSKRISFEEKLADENMTSSAIQPNKISKRRSSEEKLADENMPSSGIQPNKISKRRSSEEKLADENMPSSGIQPNKISKRRSSEEKLADENMTSSGIQPNKISKRRSSEEKLADENMTSSGIQPNKISKRRSSEEKLADENMTSSGIQPNKISKRRSSEEKLADENMPSSSIQPDKISKRRSSEEKLADDSMPSLDIQPQKISSSSTEKTPSTIKATNSSNSQTQHTQNLTERTSLVLRKLTSKQVLTAEELELRAVLRIQSHYRARVARSLLDKRRQQLAEQGVLQVGKSLYGAVHDISGMETIVGVYRLGKKYTGGLLIRGFVKPLHKQLTLALSKKHLHQLFDKNSNIRHRRDIILNLVDRLRIVEGKFQIEGRYYVPVHVKQRKSETQLMEIADELSKLAIPFLEQQHAVWDRERKRLKALKAQQEAKASAAKAERIKRERQEEAERLQQQRREAEEQSRKQYSLHHIVNKHDAEDKEYHVEQKMRYSVQSILAKQYDEQVEKQVEKEQYSLHAILSKHEDEQVAYSESDKAPNELKSKPSPTSVESPKHQAVQLLHSLLDKHHEGDH